MERWANLYNLEKNGFGIYGTQEGRRLERVQGMSDGQPPTQIRICFRYGKTVTVSCIYIQGSLRYSNFFLIKFNRGNNILWLTRPLVLLFPSDPALMYYLRETSKCLEFAGSEPLTYTDIYNACAQIYF
jgi:hypothetical protein